MKKSLLLILSLTTAAAVAGILLYAASQGVAVLQPEGATSLHQRDLFVLAVGLGLLALIPVFIMTFIIIVRYRTGRGDGADGFDPKWQIKPEASWIWAGFIVIIITVLSVVMIKSTHSIDPYLPLEAENDPMEIRVVSLPWKWLFIYPDENIATVNELVIPEKTPIEFALTADSPMSSFWIPKLGGMIYTMEGMVTKLNLMATNTGEFEGVNTEINGKGYAQMKFTTKAVSQKDYQKWVEDVRQQDTYLTATNYETLAQPTIDHPVQHYATTDPALFGQIVVKFMHSHADSGSDMHQSSHASH